MPTAVTAAQGSRAGAVSSVSQGPFRPGLQMSVTAAGLRLLGQGGFAMTCPGTEVVGSESLGGSQPQSVRPKGATWISGDLGTARK